jgi:NADP-dependent 3-hydroxy acid dehydrogenase YdfG
MNARRLAVVTGASRGIGLSVARRLLDDEMHVVMLARSGAALRDAAATYGDRATPIECDVSDPAAIEAMARRVLDEIDAVPDVVVNNAGLFRLSPAHATDPAEFAAALDVNLVAPFRVIRAFLPAMRDRKTGHIVNIGSIADRVAFPENGAYAASKFGLRGLHEVLRAELRGTGVRATLISPGPVDTALWDAVDPDNRPGFTPRASMLDPDAVANAVIYAVTQPADVNIDELRLSRS